MASDRPESHVLSDEELFARVRWPLRLTIVEIRDRIKSTSRFIDHDDTLVVGRRMRDSFCGFPLAEFLAQKPFLLQTWGSDGAVAFFRQRPLLPQPCLIISPPPRRFAVRDLAFDPMKADPDFSGDGWVCKDLAALGITHGEVYDDSPHRVWAPGCRIISDF